MSLSKLTHVVPLGVISAYKVALSFCNHCIFKYGTPETVSTDNGKQFRSNNLMLCFDTCKWPIISHQLTTHKPKVKLKGTTELLLLFYEDMWAKPNPSGIRMQQHSSFPTIAKFIGQKSTTSFDLILSRPPLELSFHHSVTNRARPVRELKQTSPRDSIQPSSLHAVACRKPKSDTDATLMQDFAWPKQNFAQGIGYTWIIQNIALENWSITRKDSTNSFETKTETCHFTAMES